MLNTILIWVIPNASKTELVETLIAADCSGFVRYPVKTRVLKIRLAAQAVDGAANNELLKFLAKHLKVAKSKIEIVKGEKSRYKVIEILTES